MKIYYRDLANKGGIYKITNAINGRIYVGSTYMFKKRGPAHRSDLKANRHANTFMQSDFNKCGEDAFIFEVLEVVEGNEETRLICEQRYLDQFFDNGKMCYNLEKKAGYTRRNRGNNQPYNAETDGRSKPHSEERKQHMSELMTEVYKNTKRLKQASEFSQKRWQEHKANITVVNQVTGKVVLVDRPLRSWCIEQGLSYKAFHLMVNGKTKSSGGWVLSNQ